MKPASEVKLKELRSEQLKYRLESLLHQLSHNDIAELIGEKPYEYETYDRDFLVKAIETVESEIEKQENANGST